MSGGSYNYLCFQLDSHGHLDLADLKAMRDRLQELAPGSRATQETARLYDMLAAVASVCGGDLTSVWYAVEWLDSGDYGIDQVQAALRKYNGAGATVGQRIRERRAARGWSQADLAARMGCTQTAISYWETGRRTLDLDDLLGLADALSVRTAELLPR